MSAWVLNTSASPGGTLLEKIEECDRYVNIPQDRMQEWCCIADPHFLLLPFTPKSALSAAAYSHEMACCKIELQKYPISNPNLTLKWVLSDQMKAKHGKE
jgi:hypothetical protein